jgi:hypothetical protein
VRKLKVEKLVDEDVFNKVVGVTSIKIVFDFNWLVKKYFFVVHRLLDSNQLNPLSPEDSSLIIFNSWLKFFEPLSPIKFCNKDNFCNSAACDN